MALSVNQERRKSVPFVAVVLKKGEFESEQMLKSMFGGYYIVQKESSARLRDFQIMRPKGSHLMKLLKFSLLLRTRRSFYVHSSMMEYFVGHVANEWEESQGLSYS
ncbi:hypothetical protein ROHU_025182 [Labeo rohita]|uniref:Uncharacterized protein n=1 Tax=Labeo rohita TaxID=84645 RepID=A0A498MLB8_LABRO|nr:hypothetical protein ROHU_029100 [Labeo rohita]RXN20144.1 hypothetical protein ROHU_025182 [Labeo rohita]